MKHIINRKLKYSILVATILLLFLISRNKVYADSVIPSTEFDDTVFYNYLISKFDTNSSQTLEVSEAEAIENINLDNLDVTSIKGIQYCINLTNFSYSKAPIASRVGLENLDYLSNLTKLTNINLYGNTVRDISGLANLNNLQNLILIYNKINDISPLSNLTNIEVLTITGNQITDISPIFSYTKLKDFNAENCNISDISFLANNPDLVRLWLINNNITDISSLKNLSKLDELRLSNNEISNPNAIANINSLSFLQMENSGITDISFLSSLVNLTSVYLSYNNITDASPLGNLSKLEALNLTNTKVTDLSMLSCEDTLIYLDAISSQIEKLANFKNNTKLSNVSLGNNKLSYEEIMSKLPESITLSEGWLEANKSEWDYTSIPTNNDEVSIAGQISTGTIFIANQKDSEEYKELIEDIAGSYTSDMDVGVYDLSIVMQAFYDATDNNIAVQPYGTAEVTITGEFKANRYKAYRINSDGSKTEIECKKQDDNTIILKIDHFCIFILVAQDLIDNDSNNSSSDTETKIIENNVLSDIEQIASTGDSSITISDINGKKELLIKDDNSKYTIIEDGNKEVFIDESNGQKYILIEENGEKYLYNEETNVKKSITNNEVNSNQNKSEKKEATLVNQSSNGDDNSNEDEQTDKKKQKVRVIAMIMFVTVMVLIGCCIITIVYVFARLHKNKCKAPISEGKDDVV